MRFGKHPINGTKPVVKADPLVLWCVGRSKVCCPALQNDTDGHVQLARLNSAGVTQRLFAPSTHLLLALCNIIT